MEIRYMAEKPMGLDIIVALQIIMGMAFIYFGLFGLILSSGIYGFILIGGGIIIFILGWELGNLTLWAWVGTIATLALGLAGFILGGNWSGPIDNILSLAPGVIIILYLLTPSVRSQFLPRKPASVNV
jgi:hypothetical protein